MKKIKRNAVLQLWAGIVVLSINFLLTGCQVGPHYKKPDMALPLKYKEQKKPIKISEKLGSWKTSEPNENGERGNWWTVFGDEKLNDLESQLNQANQSLSAAKANYRQAQALVEEARANYFPVVSAVSSVTRAKSAVSMAASSSTSRISTNRELGLDASWALDLWGKNSQTVDASLASAQASYANLRLVQLSLQAQLAQLYFQLRGLDTDQKLLDQQVVDNQALVKLTQNRYASGVDALADVVQADSQLQASQALAINNHIARQKTEHAIAVLTGQLPSVFSLPYCPLEKITVPRIPVQFPSVLLERRPDIAQAERLVAEANANIGLAKSAYFPQVNLSAQGIFQNAGSAYWLSLPSLIWSLGPSLTETLLDGGLREAQVKVSRADYQAAVSHYRETVLAAFQDVEDNLVSINTLDLQTKVQHKAANNAKLALKLVIAQYRAGVLSYSDVMTSKLAAFSAEKTAWDTDVSRLTTTVTLIEALGGGWN